MIGSPGNWTYDEVRKAVVTAIEIEGDGFASLDVSRSDAANERNIIAWAKAMGYEAELRESTETILITRAK